MNTENKNHISKEIKKEIKDLKEVNETLFDLCVTYRSDKIIEARNMIYSAIRDLEAVYTELNPSVSYPMTEIPL